MSQHSTLERMVTINDNPEDVEGIRVEQYSPAISLMKTLEEASENEEIKAITTSACKSNSKEVIAKTDANEIEKLLLEREEQLKEEFAQRVKKQISDVNEKFEFILQNEQIRTSYMLREARRERQEKISALQAQLECKNLAGLIYVMCSERRKSKFEKMRIIEEYTNYIRALQEILTDGQDLILHLSRGYKTAAKIDNEWREKMKEIIKEFQAYIYNFNGGTPEANQYLFDLPQLLTTESPVIDNPLEEPCDEEELEYEKSPPIDKSDQPWWEQLEGDCKPFIMFGDMAEFQPPQRRAVLNVLKTAKTAPKKWKKYVFNNMFLHSNCKNDDVIKDEYPKRFPEPAEWECQAVQTDQQSFRSSRRASYANRHRLTASVDIRGNMGSMLKVISSTAPQPSALHGATLLAATDSMEIASTTRLRQKILQALDNKVVDEEKAKVSATDNHISVPEEVKPDDFWMDENIGEKEKDESKSMLGSLHKDSLRVMTAHKPPLDYKIHDEKVCPVEKCQRMQVDSFIRSLPPYMRESPYMHFEQTFENYECCSPEQLEILRKRIAEKAELEKVEVDECPLAEWMPIVEGIACQTSQLDLEPPPCTCRVPAPTPEDSEAGNVYRVEDLFPIKQALNKITKECFYDDNIEFNRFEVIGQKSSQQMSEDKEEFKRTRVQEIRMILKKHPSLCDIFLTNANS